MCNAQLGMNHAVTFRSRCTTTVPDIKPKNYQQKKKRKENLFPTAHPGLYATVPRECNNVESVLDQLLSICIHLGRLEIPRGNGARSGNCTSVRCFGHSVDRVLFVKENVTLF